MKKICLDYGHGGVDPGACYKGRKESQDVLKLGKAIASRLRQEGIEVDETRKADRTTSLWARANLANKKTYDFFISFHRNAYKPEKASGVEVFVYSKPANKTKLMGGAILDSLANLGFKNRGLKKANFYLLRKTKCPALLVEVGFIDNTKDNDLYDKAFDDIVELVSKAIEENI